jgi:hypothetical protein
VYSRLAPGKTWTQYGDLPTGDGCTSFNAGTTRANKPGLCLTFDYLINVNNEHNNIPEKFALYQNYPNPFNPFTVIKYDVPKNVKRQTSNVKLIVFDVTGKEIATLINGEREPGTYEVTFDARNLPSGVYFYKITAGEFTDTKKLVLIK